MSECVTSNDIPVSIVRNIIKDIYGHYGLEQFFRSIDPKSQVDIYEDWMKIGYKLYPENFIRKV